MKRRNESGNALVEFIWLGLLLLVPLVYILLAVFDVQRGAFGVTAASRAAGRAFTLADSVEEGKQRALAAAKVALHDQGIDGDFDLDITCRPQPCLSPGSVTTVRIRTQVVLPLAPPALDGRTPSIRVESVHRVPTGLYVEWSR